MVHLLTVKTDQNHIDSDHTESQQITELLKAVRGGVPDADEALFSCIYTELHRMAHAAWRWVPASDTLQPTALVNEMYARLFHQRDINWENRRHFFATASRAMHDILVEQARRHCSIKRGGNLKRMPLDEQENARVQTQASDVLALDDALKQLRVHYPEHSRIVMLKMFAGLTYNQIAEIEQCSAVTVRRGWAFAKTWLKDHISGEDY